MKNTQVKYWMTNIGWPPSFRIFNQLTLLLFERIVSRTLFVLKRGSELSKEGGFSLKLQSELNLEGVQFNKVKTYKLFTLTSINNKQMW